MIFEVLYESAQRGELLLVDGGMCHYHHRRDGQVTIGEILVLPERQRQGIGRALLEKLKATPGATSLFAKCPEDLESNAWYAQMGFILESVESTRTGRKLNCWRMAL